jgi:hypothetical protein
MQKESIIVLQINKYIYKAQEIIMTFIVQLGT